VITPSGKLTSYTLFFKHIGTRCIWLSGTTPHPTRQWVTQQARNFCMHLHDLGMSATHLIRDHDNCYSKNFDDVLAGDGITVVPSKIGVPEMNGYAEAFVKTIKTECLDYFTACSEAHLWYLMKTYVDDYYNVSRPHRGLNNRPITQADPQEHSATFGHDDIVCDELLGGIIKQYRWKDAA
jgi:putative transposase